MHCISNIVLGQQSSIIGPKQQQPANVTGSTPHKNLLLTLYALTPFKLVTPASSTPLKRSREQHVPLPGIWQQPDLSEMDKPTSLDFQQQGRARCVRYKCSATQTPRPPISQVNLESSCLPGLLHELIQGALLPRLGSLMFVVGTQVARVLAVATATRLVPISAPVADFRVPVAAAAAVLRHLAPIAATRKTSESKGNPPQRRQVVWWTQKVLLLPEYRRMDRKVVGEELMHRIFALPSPQPHSRNTDSPISPTLPTTPKHPLLQVRAASLPILLLNTLAGNECNEAQTRRISQNSDAHAHRCVALA